jgi:hypothetical protein
LAEFEVPEFTVVLLSFDEPEPRTPTPLPETVTGVETLTTLPPSEDCCDWFNCDVPELFESLLPLLELELELELPCAAALLPPLAEFEVPEFTVVSFPLALPEPRIPTPLPETVIGAVALKTDPPFADCWDWFDCDTLGDFDDLEYEPHQSPPLDFESALLPCATALSPPLAEFETPEFTVVSLCFADPRPSRIPTPLPETVIGAVALKTDPPFADCWDWFDCVVPLDDVMA